ncbi:hypothetical protein KP509_22G027700 [Ceratopteris richardii]|uniref:HIG1 domain-containing protein n=1 Tax=Ceratopteris richardii TaxID=49495 RepID=A0A8T2S680_CERRI|nr:hypothetical protein KP509_22G027700 [Ceratopteris richardii]
MDHRLHTIVDEANRSTLDDIKEWMSQNKLKSVGMVWLSGVASSLAYNWSRPHMKTSVKIMHARVHSQALTLGALVAAAGVEYYGRARTSKDNDHLASQEREN